ncbi:hypothetical protein LS70_007270 [Helicobacter sp. MIT 11-5569]|uniref:hypothetical protein n=1 Tax=Helicobacter sp. MIT 11-5569 TaxID=1548151 RepID=UPI000691613E|nr:hypothetical protein [Helicobacter sp. MIT 11-5569]TLD82398.1 hypothetical protein LS70_007270 [Helicobacter sp. MIT 11-5569]
MLANKVENPIENALKDLKECQAQQKVTSCILCNHATNCDKKEAFEQKTLQNLTEKQESLKACQESKGLSSCLNCAELLDCAVRNNYVSAVYLSMNKGNGGSFEF